MNSRADASSVRESRDRTRLFEIEKVTIVRFSRSAKRCTDALMLRTHLLGLGFVTALCFAACGDDGKGSGDGGDDNPKGGDSGTAGTPSGGSGGSGGKSTGGASTGGKATGGSPTGGKAGSGGSTSGAGGEGGEGAEGGALGPAGAGGQGGEGGAACVPTEPPDEVCDGTDNDCNGEVDDIDVGHDGIRDCLRILLIGGPGAGSSSNFQAWLEEQGTTVSRIHQSGTANELTAADLNGFDITILDNLIRDYTVAESQALLTWVRGGHGLMSMNGHTGGPDLTRGNSLLVGFGVEHLAGLRSGNVTIFHPHPLTTGLTSVTFSGGYRLGNLTASEGSTVVAEITDGPVGLALSRGNGRAFVWGDEWVQFDSQWMSLPEIKQFWVNSIGWLSHTL
jgi:hypothetical protein